MLPIITMSSAPLDQLQSMHAIQCAKRLYDMYSSCLGCSYCITGLAVNFVECFLSLNFMKGTCTVYNFGVMTDCKVCGVILLLFLLLF